MDAKALKSLGLDQNNVKGLLTNKCSIIGYYKGIRSGHREDLIRIEYEKSADEFLKEIRRKKMQDIKSYSCNHYYEYKKIYCKTPIYNNKHEASHKFIYIVHPHPH